ncbi:MAG: hypothetical protein AAF329_01950 [Cyanobacteria bacterium P01_A01_bin.17]
MDLTCSSVIEAWSQAKANEVIDAQGITIGNLMKTDASITVDAKKQQILVFAKTEIGARLLGSKLRRLIKKPDSLQSYSLRVMTCGAYRKWPFPRRA